MARPPIPRPPESRSPRKGPHMPKFELDTGNITRLDPNTLYNVSRAEFDALMEQVYRLNKTIEGLQQLLVKAGEYQGKPRGRLTR